MKVFYFMMLVLVAGAVPCHGRTESEGTVFNKTQPHESMNNVTVSSSKLVTYGYLYLAMQWPASFCMYRRCYRQGPNRFTVHGLWPQYDPSENRGPLDCLMPRYEGYFRFNNRRLDGRLVPRLNKNWPDLKSVEDNRLWDNNNQWFWGREYNKHGSCTFRNENEYFTLALTMAEYLGDLISRIRGKIMPGNFYRPSDIREAVYQVTHIRPTLHCFAFEDIQILWETRFCAYGNGQLFDCIDDSNCRKSVVFLPLPQPL